MCPSPTQANQTAELHTPLGDDVLLLTDFTAHEELSNPFEYRIELICESDTVDFNKLIGENCCVRLNTTGENKRYFNGIAVEGNQTGKRADMESYTLVLRPWIWLLDHGTDCRIFQNLTVLEIIKKVFTDHGFSDFEDQTETAYVKMDYCVQYQETHLNFVSRLMQAFGIYYFFKHEKNKHTLVLADTKSAHVPIDYLPSIAYAQMGENARDGEEHIDTLRRNRAFMTGKVKITSYDFKKPRSSLVVEANSPPPYKHNNLEIYDYYEKYKVGEIDNVGNNFARSRIEAIQAIDERRYCTGLAPSLHPGAKFDLTDCDRKAENMQYMVVAATHIYSNQTYSSSLHQGQGSTYTGSYILQPQIISYKSPQVAHVPRIYGPQTAIVVGKGGEEIWTDEYGRIKIQFPWDREGGNDENSSCWARVAQVWSGKGWGGQFVPRIGMEVIVEFLEGDPDRPLIIGTLYNGVNSVPYSLPDNQSKSGMLSNSTKSGNGANELMFEDKKGKELVRFNAEKDLESTIENSEKRMIKAKDSPKVARETTITQGDDSLTLSDGDNIVEITGNQKIHVTQDQSVKADSHIVLEAHNSITLKVGDNSITIKPDGIYMKSMNFAISADAVDVKASAKMNFKSPILFKN